MLFKNFEIADLWKIYEKAFEIGKRLPEESTSSSLYYNLRIPILILLYELVNCDEIKQMKSPASHSYQDIFDNLRDIIDRNQSSSHADKLMKRITQEILKHGVLVFFPSEVTRKDVFMQMIDNNSNNIEQSRFSFQCESTHFLFEAFCNLYCLNKSLLLKYLLNDATNMFESLSCCTEALNFVDKLITFSFFLTDSLHRLNEENKLINALNDLLNSIQSNIFYNVKEHLARFETQRAAAADAVMSSATAKTNSLVEANIQTFLLDYARLIIAKSNQLISKLLEKRKHFDSINVLKLFVTPAETLKLKNFLNKTVNNFVLWLSELFGQLELNTCTTLVENLVELHSSLSQIEKYVDHEVVG